VSVSRNITSHREKGIGAWTDAEIKGRHHAGRAQGRHQAQAAYGLPALCDYDRRRPQRSHRLSAHGAGEGIIFGGRSRNITSHREKGIGAWTDAEIKGAITRGERKDGTKLSRLRGVQYKSFFADHDARRLIQSSTQRLHGVSSWHRLCENVLPFAERAL
jgi:hypothetical protein